jgi:hypothetical protein
MTMNKIRHDGHNAANNAADSVCWRQMSSRRVRRVFVGHGGLPTRRVRVWWPAVFRPGSRLRRSAVLLHSRWFRRPEGALH